MKEDDRIAEKRLRETNIALKNAIFTIQKIDVLVAHILSDLHGPHSPAKIGAAAVIAEGIQRETELFR